MAILPITEVTKYDVEGAPGTPFNTIDKARRAACLPDLVGAITIITGPGNTSPDNLAKMLLTDLDRAAALQDAIAASISFINAP